MIDPVFLAAFHHYQPIDISFFADSHHFLPFWGQVLLSLQNNQLLWTQIKASK